MTYELSRILTPMQRILTLSALDPHVLHVAERYNALELL